MANKEKVPRYWNNKKVQYFSNIQAQLDAAQTCCSDSSVKQTVQALAGDAQVDGHVLEPGKC